MAAEQVVHVSKAALQALAPAELRALAVRAAQDLLAAQVVVRQLAQPARALALQALARREALVRELAVAAVER